MLIPGSQTSLMLGIFEDPERPLLSWRWHTEGMRCLLGAVMEEEWREIEKVVGRASWTGAQGKPPRRGCMSREASHGRNGGRRVRGMYQVPRLQRSSPGKRGAVKAEHSDPGWWWWEVGVAARSSGVYHLTWNLDFTQSINSESGELWFAFLKDHCSCCVWNW